jgi:hypothetical protein
MEVVCLSEVLAIVYQSALSRIPEGGTFTVLRSFCSIVPQLSVTLIELTVVTLISPKCLHHHDSLLWFVSRRSSLSMKLINSLKSFYCQRNNILLKHISLYLNRGMNLTCSL